MRRARIFALALVVVALTPVAAHAQQASGQQPPNPSTFPPRQANYAWDQDQLRASFSYRDVLETSPGHLDPALSRKLDSGLVMHIVVRAGIYEDGTGTPVAVALRVCDVRYDLWDTVYLMHISDPEHDHDQSGLVQDAVVRNCAQVSNFPIAKRGTQLTSGKSYFLGVVVDVNPVSQEMLEQMQKWVARPTGNRDIGSGDALFGGFVRLFVRPIGTGMSDKTIMFKTQSIVVP
jgi:hypothetical protein